MGPPIFIGGNTGTGARADRGKRASMGPPIFIGGNVEQPVDNFPKIGGFNGAADFHRRKSANRFARAGDRSGFNGAADFHRRKCQFRQCFLGALFRFNGAADFHRRK